MPNQRRKRLPPEKRDTRRRFEQWATNPACDANTISAVHGISMAAVAKREGLTPSMGQSPFAVARGQTFERGLFRDGAQELIEELRRTGMPMQGSSGARVLRTLQGALPSRAIDRQCRGLRSRRRGRGKSAWPALRASLRILVGISQVASAEELSAGVPREVGGRRVTTRPDRG